MKFLKSIFQFFWSIYFLITFFLLMAISLIIFKIQYFLFKTKYEIHYKNYLFIWIGSLIQYSCLIFTKDSYHYRYDKNQSYIVVGNHNSAIDIPIHTSKCPRDINLKFVSKAEAAKIPLVGTLIKNLSVLVNRKSVESRKNTFELMKAELDKGYSIFLYPEGTRNRTKEELKDFFDGAFRMAIEHNLPIVVSTLVGTKKINSPKSVFSFMPGIVSSHWEIPILTEGLTRADIPMLKEKVKNMMLKRIHQS